ncbi:MAG: ribonuclease R [Coriobacteriales bacterium]
MPRRSRPRNNAKGRGHSSRLQGNCPLGVIDIAREGYGFVETEEGVFYIPANRTGGAMNGDTVEVRPRSSRHQAGQRREAVVVRVHRRATEYVVGVVEVCDPLAAVVPQDPRIQHDVFIDLRQSPQVKNGDMVLARITGYPSRSAAATGYVVEVLGASDQPGIDVDAIIHEHGLATAFSPQALEQARSLDAAIPAALEEPSRHDLRSREVFTIDPADARDFDDAISIDEVGGLTRLGVHIADVSSYVEWDSSIDICARDRATSVYLVDRVLPMLPEELSCDICSLRPGVERRALTCDMHFDASGVLRRYQIFPSVIRSRRRFTYGQAQELLDAMGQGARPTELGEPLAGKLWALHQLAGKLLALREQRGSLDFDNPEAKPVLDEEGRPLRIDLRVKNDATSMIEEAMIAANECVAAHLHRKQLPCVFRIHESPGPKALEGLLPVLRELGYSTAGLAAGETAAYQRLLAEARLRPDGQLVDSMVLRSMERARYSVQPLPHFGLASSCYCHFTSPIRRYPDLMVHRLLKDPSAMEGQLEWLAEHASKMERAAEGAERDSVNLKICQFMAGKVGERFEATIAAVHAYGFMVRLDNTAEGFVRFDPVRHEYCQFDPKLQTLMGEETGRTYRLGQRVKVTLARVDLRDQTLDFEL